MFREEILYNIDSIKKAGLPEGTIREWKGEKFQKVGGKWLPVKKEREKKEEEPKEKPTKAPEEHAKDTPTKNLQKFVKESKDEKLKKVAEKELEGRKEGEEPKKKKEKVEERQRHRFEFNNSYRDAFESEGMRLSGVSPDNRLVEIAELEDHPFMLGTQFHPEFLSRPTRPHPLFLSFVEALRVKAGIGQGQEAIKQEVSEQD